VQTHLQLVALLILGAMASNSTVAEPAFDEAAAYAARVKQMQAANSVPNDSVYDLMEDVPGALHAKPLPVRPVKNNTLNAEALEAARAYAARNNSKAFIVWRDGAIETENYFGIDADTATVSRSLSKPLTAVAVGRAIALGKINSLDQPLVDFFPEWQGSYKSQMLVRHLLDMRSGLLVQGAVSDPASIWTRAYLGTRHDQVLINEYPLTHTPGSYYEYSNAPSELVAVLIERATGRRYAEFVSSEIFKPIGAPGGKIWIDRPGGTAHSGCCLLTPARTWLRLAILLLHDGVWDKQRLLPEGYVQAMRTPTAQNAYAGLGVWVAGPYIERRGAGNPNSPGPKTLHSEAYLASDLYLFDGNANQVVYIIPSQRMIVVRTGDAPPRSPEWDNALLPNTLIHGIK
jgi:CubicO group peptidase (beta-lactamase class C family)